MFLLRKPNEENIHRFITTQRNLPFSYSEVGATNSGPPEGYNIDHNRVKLGEGEATYERAVAALKTWKHFDLGWVTIVPPGTNVEVGSTVAVMASTFGVWSLNGCRVVYVIEEDRGRKRFGFAYGTLPDHVESGEERFMIELLEDQSVWYDLYAFSRPTHPLSRFGFPIARQLQKNFAKASLAAMVAASR